MGKRSKKARSAKPAHRIALSSARKRNGTDLQTSIRARGMCHPPQLEAGHTSAPDHMLITDDRFCLHPQGRPHTSGEASPAFDYPHLG
jgi:hypothetical protein